MDKIFEIDAVTHFIGGFVERFTPLWLALGGVETQLLGRKLKGITIDRPVYITGLARAGTTTLLEVLASIDGVISHRYRDYPGLFTPILWNWFLDHARTKPQVPKERAHRDGIYVTPESPEALEEPLWRAFPSLSPTHPPVDRLDRRVEDPAFETFYTDHIRKILFIRGGTRYVAKANYNVTRLAYLQKLFPDARFVIAIRHPHAHVGSLMKQHELFCRGEADEPRARAHLRRVGHFEFGLDRRAINTGDNDAWRSVEALWQGGDEVRGWARYWASIYGHVHDLLASDEAMRKAVRVVRYEDLCADPTAVTADVLAHCALPKNDQLLANLGQGIKAPNYYRPKLSAEDAEVIAEETKEVAQEFGYEPRRH